MSLFTLSILFCPIWHWYNAKICIVMFAFFSLGPWMAYCWVLSLLCLLVSQERIFTLDGCKLESQEKPKNPHNWTESFWHNYARSKWLATCRVKLQQRIAAWPPERSCLGFFFKSSLLMYSWGLHLHKLSITVCWAHDSQTEQQHSKV